MEGEDEEKQRDQAVQFGKDVIRHAAQQRDQQQRHGGVEGPFPHGLGQTPHGAKRRLDRIARLRSRPARRARDPTQLHRPLRPLDPQPMGEGEDERADSQPLVQTVGFVQPAEKALDGAQAQREHHGRTHAAEGEHAAQLRHHLAPGEERVRFVECRLGRQPQQGRAEQQGPQPMAHPIHHIPPQEIFILLASP